MKTLREVRPPSTLLFAPTNMGRIRQLTEELSEELSEDQTTLYLFFKLASNLFCVADSTGYFQKVNQAWSMILGWTEEELLSIPFIKFIHPDDISRTQDIVHMKKNDIIRFHNRYRRKSGTTNLIEEKSIAGDDDYVTLEWSSTALDNGLTYAAARQVPASCLQCSESE